MSDREEESLCETSNTIYNVDNKCVIYVETPQWDDESEQGRYLEYVIPERLCEDPQRNEGTKCSDTDRGFSRQ